MASNVYEARYCCYGVILRTKWFHDKKVVFAGFFCFVWEARRLLCEGEKEKEKREKYD